MFNPNQAFLLVQKLKSAPRAFLTLGLKAEKNLKKKKKSFQICPQVAAEPSSYDLVLAQS